MHEIASLIKWHPMLSGMLGMAVANCAITSLPTPETNGYKFYQWFFNFTHALVLAIPRIVAQYKDDPSKV